MGEVSDRFISVVLGLGNIIIVFELEDFDFLRFVIFGGVDYGEFVGIGKDGIFGVVLVIESVMINDDGFFLSRDKVRDMGNYDGFMENGIIEGVMDGFVRGELYLFEFEFFDMGFIGGNSGVFDINGVFFNSFSGVEGDFVIGLVMVFEVEIVVFEVDIEVR